MIILIFCSDTLFSRSFVLIHSLVLMSISPESTFTFPKSETTMFHRKAMARAYVRSQFPSNVFEQKNFLVVKMFCFILGCHLYNKFVHFRTDISFLIQTGFVDVHADYYQVANSEVKR